MAGAIDFMIISFYILRESMEARVRTWAEGGPSSGTVMTRGALWGWPTWEGPRVSPGDVCEGARHVYAHDPRLAGGGVCYLCLSISLLISLTMEEIKKQ